MKLYNLEVGNVVYLVLGQTEEVISAEVTKVDDEGFTIDTIVGQVPAKLYKVRHNTESTLDALRAVDASRMLFIHGDAEEGWDTVKGYARKFRRSSDNVLKDIGEALSSIYNSGIDKTLSTAARRDLFESYSKLVRGLCFKHEHAIGVVVSGVGVVEEGAVTYGRVYAHSATAEGLI